jgi:hypothetical protein
MSALLLPPLCGQLPVAPPILRDSPYANDRDHSLSLLAATCLEQYGRFHMLQLLTEYLGCCAGRKRQIVTAEIKALQELYHVTWCELGCAFPAGLVRQARATTEKKDPVANALQATKRIRVNVAGDVSIRAVRLVAARYL